MGSPDPTSRRGPKRAGAEVRRALLRAGGALIAERGGTGWTLGEAASRAGVTPAMVRYYFSSKQGFLVALLEAGFAPVLAELEDTEPGDARAEARLARLLRHLAEHPWLPALVLRSVLEEDGPLRETFVTAYAPRIAAAGRRLLADAAAAGQARTDLDPRLTFVSVLSMVVFPFLARPALERVLGLRLDEAYADAQARHIVRLLDADDGEA